MSSKTEIINFSFLLEQEKKTILSVLERDDRLKKADEKRVRRLKNELLEIQRKGNNRHQLRQQQNSKLCVRCRKSLGLIFNRGSLCQVCHLRVCKACRVVVKDGKWKCTVCAKIAQLKLTTGDWFCEERGKRFRIGTVYGSDIVRKSLLRKIPAVSKPDEEVGDSGKQVPANVQNGSVLENKSAKGDDGRSIRSDIDNQSLYSNRSLPRSDRISSLFDKVTGKKAKSKEDDTLSLQSVRSDRKAKVIVHSDSSQADLTEQENTDKISQASFKVDVLSQSRPGSPVSARGSVDSLDAGVSSPNPKGNAPSSYESSSINVIGTLPSRQSSPTPRKLSAASNSHSRSGMQDGIKTSSSIPEDISKGHERRVSATPSLVISRASLSSGHSKSEFDLSGNFTDENLESISVRSKSVPDHLDKDSEYLDKIDEDFDDLGPSTNMTKSMNAHTLSDRKWTHLNVPDADADTRSLTSISLYSETGDYGNLRITGEILLNINYSYKTGALNVVVKSCRNLAVADEKKNRTDPYVKAYLLPDKSRQSKRKTKIKTNTTDPDFNETLKYVISHTQLETRTLQLTVWHNDRFGRNSFLGEVDIPLDSWNFENQEDESFPLQPKMDLASDVTLQYKGEITVGLRYVTPEKNLTLPLDKVTEKKSFKKSKKANIKVPSGGLVEVFIKDAKNLTAMKSGGSSDTFVKGYLLPDNNKSTKHKTPVVKKSVNPEWNHTFTFSGLQTSDLSNVCVELTVWGKESLTNNVFLGGVCLGCGSGVSYGDVVDWMDSQGEEQFLWQKMMDSPGTMVEATLMLRPTMAKKKYNSVKA
ncbi:synaptotagmin-like protein 5 isoform X1 [Xenopus laevis]|uniref:Synaptotagmin-like protein 5 n=1 Tax=Xenopus laevis TaxID=8355 RepID=A0A8J0UDL9_XENLA|nr:synaptotagmin-like protein 5 isoform X1 [Xenopus laevis]XP_018102117.1 synaptotagmin-like protein 5 isoform X1 [Xenopus laevis]